MFFLILALTPVLQALTPVLLALALFQASPGLDKLNADLLISLTGVVLSYLGLIIPPFRKWLEGLGDWTPAFMAGFLLAVAVVYQFVWCGWGVACFLANWQSVVMIWVMAFGMNQGFYKAAVKPVKDLQEKAALLRSDTSYAVAKKISWPGPEDR